MATQRDPWLLFTLDYSGGQGGAISVQGFRNQKELRQYLIFNEWRSRQVQDVLDGNVWHDGEVKYRAFPLSICMDAEDPFDLGMEI